MRSICSEYGCPNLVEDGGRCPAHRLSAAERRAAGQTGARGSTARWRRLRSAVLARDDYRCQDPACVDPVTDDNPLEVHHRDGDPANNQLENLVALCRKAHDRADRKLHAPPPTLEIEGHRYPVAG